MIVKIGKGEIDTYREICALSEYRANFYSIESNDLLVQVEILELNGDDLTNVNALILGRTIAWRLANELVK